MQRIVTTIPKAVLNPKIYIPIPAIHQKRLSLGYEYLLKAAQKHSLTPPKHEPTSYIQVKNSLLHGQYVAPTELNQLEIRLKGNGSYLVSVHDLDAVHENQVVDECHWFGKVTVTDNTCITLGTEQDSIVKFKPILPILSNPKRMHRILICAWKDGAQPTSFKLHDLHKQLELSSFGFVTTHYDANTHELYAKYGIHEPIYGTKLPNIKNTRKPTNMITRMDLKALEMGLKQTSKKTTDKYVEAVERVREREGIVIKKQSPNRYLNA